jgi:peptide-methionine (S)-S-oxide reductase
MTAMNFMRLLGKKFELPTAQEAIIGRAQALPTATEHFVSKRPLKGPYPEGFKTAVFGLGCFWGAERCFWQTEGVWVTMAGYSGGYTENPTYEEVCSGLTGHNEVVRVVYDAAIISYAGLLKLFFESHDPTQGMRQGNDAGTQYRSGIYVENDEDRALAEAARSRYDAVLGAKGFKPVTTEIVAAGPFYFAEAYHQQYLAKNPNGYCGLGGTGVSCPLPTGVTT